MNRNSQQGDVEPCESAAYAAQRHGTEIGAGERAKKKAPHARRGIQAHSFNHAGFPATVRHQSPPGTHFPPP